MAKIKRTERIVALAKMLVDQPCRLYSLTEFSEMFGTAKSTISEDLVIVKQSLQNAQMGSIETVNGASGGVRYVPLSSDEHILRDVQQLCTRLCEPARIIPGGFLYMSDILYSPPELVRIGEIFFNKFAHLNPNYILTIETKGIPLALTTARAFHIPLVVARRGSKVTEGSAVGINYVSGSAKRIQSMTLTKRALAPNSNVLIIDDFMKAGGTARGLVDLVGEVGARTVGVGVLVETAKPKEKLVTDYLSLMVLQEVDEATKTVTISPSQRMMEEQTHGRRSGNFTRY